MAHKSLLVKEEVTFLMRRQGGFEECPSPSLSLHLGLPSPTHAQPSAGPCLQLQNGHIFMSCADQHDGQGLRLGLPPFNNNNSNEKGTHHQTMKIIGEEDIDLCLCLSTQFSPQEKIELHSEDGMKLKKKTLVYKEGENVISSKVIHDDIKSLSTTASSASSNTFPSEGRNNEVDSYLKNKKDFHNHKEKKKDGSVGGKEMKKDNSVGGQEMMTMGCAHCLLYVLMCKDEPKCPKCGSSALLSLRDPIHNQYHVCKKRRREETSVFFNEDNKSEITPNVAAQY